MESRNSESVCKIARVAIAWQPSGFDYWEVYAKKTNQEFAYLRPADRMPGSFLICAARVEREIMGRSSKFANCCK
jgi:hypothetical protein